MKSDHAAAAARVWTTMSLSVFTRQLPWALLQEGIPLRR